MNTYCFSERQARQITKDGRIPSNIDTDNAGAILNCKGPLEFSQQGVVDVTFRSMQLKKIKRAERRGQEVRRGGVIQVHY